METKKAQPEALIVNGTWEPQAKQLKSKFSQLTDVDLKFEIGKENDLLNRIGKRINKSREEGINIIKKGQGNKS